jgi:predicted GNAT superfamily acetyltransferase
MAAIITDQLRILNAKTFVSYATSSANALYSFVGLPNANDYSSNWDVNPPAPKDNFDQENDYWDTMIALKKIGSDDVKQVIRKITWSSGTTYDMYRHDISRTNLSKPSGATSIYSANFYVVNQDYKVYICLQNGTDPENPNGRPSLDEPTFTDLEPRAAGNSGDGYIWKYLYTIKPSDIIKFDSLNYISVPKDWETNSTDAAVRNNAATSGQLKIATITNRGVGLGTANRTYTRVPIKGDGTGAEATITINNDSKVDSITISKGGSGYTYGSVDLVAGNVPTGTTRPTFDVIIPPKGGHGADIYRELGAYNVLIYSRIENDTQDPDFITGNQIARIGIVENPLAYNSTSLLSLPKASAVNALKLTGIGYSSATFSADSLITQTVGLGSTAVGRVISYDQNTGVLKYWQDRNVAGFNTNGTQNTNPTYGFKLNRFTSNPVSGGNVTIQGGSVSLSIDTNFTGVSTVINSRTYYLGQSFNNGVANPEVERHSGNIIYVDNRPSITRSSNQKEDIKVILQF